MKENFLYLLVKLVADCHGNHLPSYECMFVYLTVSPIAGRGGTGLLTLTVVLCSCHSRILKAGKYDRLCISTASRPANQQLEFSSFSMTLCDSPLLPHSRQIRSASLQVLHALTTHRYNSKQLGFGHQTKDSGTQERS